MDDFATCVEDRCRGLAAVSSAAGRRCTEKARDLSGFEGTGVKNRIDFLVFVNLSPLIISLSHQHSTMMNL